MVMAAVLAAAQALVAGGALVEVLPGKWAAFAALLVGAVTVGWGVYVEGQVTPLRAPRDAYGRPLAAHPTRRSWPTRAPSDPPDAPDG